MPRALDDYITGLLLFVHSAYSSPTIIIRKSAQVYMLSAEAIQ